MKIDTICDNPNLSNTYVVTIDDECIIIDPSNSIKNIKYYVGNSKVLGILLTHGHFDHFKTLVDVASKYKAKVFLHKNAILKLKDYNLSCASMFGYLYNVDTTNLDLKNVGNGNIIELGRFKIKVMETKGHTNCSICFIIDDIMFSGDTIFYEGIGRYDLPTGNMVEIRQSIDTIKHLKNDYIIYPGHGDATTLEHEIKCNPYFK